MRYVSLLLLTLLSSHSFADTIDHYIHISSSIPVMEMKADQEAQAWARSARNVLTITNESIAETLTEANALAKTKGAPLFCLPHAVELDAKTLKSLIEQAYEKNPRIQHDKENMTVSQVAWLAVTQSYPCQRSSGSNSSMTMAMNQASTMQHADTDDE